MPVVDLGKLRRFLEKAVGKKAMDKLLIHREEAAAGGKLYREAALRLWEIADALPPPRDLGPVTESTHSSPVYARFWLKPEVATAKRNAP